MDYAHYIDGSWVDDSDFSENINPANTEDIVGRFARGDAGRVDQAVAAAAAAQPDWAGASPQVRHDVLEKAGALIMSRKDELGRLLAREEGKTLAEAVGETIRAAQIFKFFAGEALRNLGDAVASVRPGVDVMMEREAVGIVGLITPWNFPIAIPAWKIAPALAFGNAVVMKPAELTPACAWELAKILDEAGCPKGVFNLVMGAGSVIGARIAEHPDIDAVSFTGSVPTGRQIGVTCASLGKKVQMEMGGKNPMVVMDDADLQVAIGACLNGAFFSTGQRCTASSRLIVTKGIYDRFVDALTAAADQLVVGDPLDSATQIGPVVDGKQQLTAQYILRRIGWQTKGEEAGLGVGEVAVREFLGSSRCPLDLEAHWKIVRAGGHPAARPHAQAICHRCRVLPVQSLWRRGLGRHLVLLLLPALHGGADGYAYRRNQQRKHVRLLRHV